jgi:hypothetical protein
LDRFQDNEMAVLLLYPEGRRSCNVPRELLPREAQPGDVFEVSFAPDRRETEHMAAENRRLIDELLERNG